MSIFGKLFGSNEVAQNKIKPFYLNATRDERRDWFAHNPQWNRISPAVVDAILDGITDRVLLEAFVVVSMENGLVTRYELLGGQDADATIIRAQISQILCEVGNRAVVSLI